MTTPIHPKPAKFLMPRDINATGPQNESEQRLLDLINEALENGPSPEINIDEFAAELHARIKAKR